MNFHDFPKDYRADGERSYLTLSVSAHQDVKQYQIDMLEKNHIEVLLPFYAQRMNDEWLLSYDITSKISLDRILERRCMNHHEFEMLVMQFARLMRELKDYLLDLSSIVLDNAYIFCDPSEGSLYFIYIPVKTNACEPERLKSFLKQLIVEDIRLMDDSSGSLLKRVLEVLKSESFSSERLYHSVERFAITAQMSVAPLDDQQGEPSAVFIPEERHASHKIIPGFRPPAAQSPKPNSRNEVNHFCQNKAQAKTQVPFDAKSKAQAHQPAPVYVQTQAQAHTQAQTRAQSQSQYPFRNQTDTRVVNQSSDMKKILRYPIASYLITGGINIVLSGIFISILISGKNPDNTLSSVLGLLLVAAAGNYFLITRLFSKDKKINSSHEKCERNKKEPTKKRFVNTEIEEDIILPGSTPVFKRDVKNSGNSPIQPSRVQEILIGDRPMHFEKAHANLADDRPMYFEKAYVNPCSDITMQSTQTAVPIPQNITHEKGISSDVPDRLSQPETTLFEDHFPQLGTNYSDTHLEKKNLRQGTCPPFADKTIILSPSSAEHIPILQSQSSPTEKMLINKDSILIGRLTDSVDYTVHNKAVGKIHAEIMKKGEGFYIVDLNSANGTYINGKRLLCNTEAQINNGDRITLANESYMFIA